jgi:hypothetical protein
MERNLMEGVSRGVVESPGGGEKIRQFSNMAKNSATFLYEVQDLMVRTSYEIASLSREGLPGPGFREPTSAPFTLFPPDGRFPTGPLAGEWRRWAINAGHFTRRQSARIPPSKTGDSSPDSSSPSTPLAVRLRPSSSSLSPAPAVGDESRASGRACSPIRLSTD